MSSFQGLEIAKTGLFLSRQALNLTGHNIANANTAGYTRQRFITASIDPGSAIGRFGTINSRRIGGGVDVQTLDQIRNSFIDKELRREYSMQNELEIRAQALSYMESLFEETSDSSLSKAMANFFDSMNELTTDASSKELRTDVRQNAIALTETFNHYYMQLLELQKSQNEEIRTTVEEINNCLIAIGDYNKQIFAYELSGEKANDLRDKRNLLLDSLSELVNIEYYENTEGQLIVTVEGNEFINHTTVTKLYTAPDEIGVVTGEPDFYRVYVEGTTDEFEFSGGKLFAHMKMRDGNSADDIGIPRIIDSLNTLARSIAKEFNAVHSAGYTLPDGSEPSKTGVNFFDVPSGDYNLVTAGNIKLSDDILQSVYNIAASDTLIDPTGGNPQQGNNKNALRLVELSSKNDLDTVSNFESYFKNSIVEIAVESAHVQKLLNSQSSIVENLENRRLSYSSVSIDEEMVEMIKWQHSFSAATRVINAIDEEMETLINKMGIVGR